MECVSAINGKISEIQSKPLYSLKEYYKIIAL